MMDSAIRTVFLMLLDFDLTDEGWAASRIGEENAAEMIWETARADWTGQPLRELPPPPCGGCGGRGWDVQTWDHCDPDGEYIGTEQVQVPCPYCGTGEQWPCGVFPEGQVRR